MRGPLELWTTFVVLLGCKTSSLDYFSRGHPVKSVERVSKFPMNNQVRADKIVRYKDEKTTY